MALANLNKDVLTRLMKMITTDDNASYDIKSDHATYAKLSLLANQMHLLQEQARQVLAESSLNSRLRNVDMTIQKVPGTVYHLYKQNGKEVLSIISPSEWDVYEEYIGSFLYDYDHSFKTHDIKH